MKPAALFIFLSISLLVKTGGAQEVTASELRCDGAASHPVHLTFDDGPKLPETEQILNILKKNNIKATFFISASRFKGLLAGRPTAHEMKLIALIERMKTEGHIIGSHSFEHIAHATPSQTSREEAAENLRKSSQVMDKLNIKWPIVFRFPYGSGWVMDRNIVNRRESVWAMGQVKSMGFTPVHWDIDSWDWSAIKRKAWPRSVLGEICSLRGGIILMHDVQPFTARNLQAMINSIEKSGHTFVSYDKIALENKTRPDDDKFISLIDFPFGIGYCDRSRGNFDQIWASCLFYAKKSSGIRRKGSLGVAK